MNAKRLREIEDSGVRRMFAKAGPGAIHMGLGQPDFQPPDVAIKALINAVKSGYNAYCPIEGLPELREVIANRLRKYHEDIEMDNILVTNGATEALHVANFSILDEGDEILIPNPGFVLFESQPRLTGAKPIHYPIIAENDHLPQPDDILERITNNTRAIIVNTPSNPTGAVHNKDVIKAIVDIAEDYGLFIISDEVYDEIIYEKEHHSYLGKYDKLIYINSFSKTFCMTGWRLGYIAANKEILPLLRKFHFNTVACVNTPVQHAAIATLKAPQDHIKKILSAFTFRRNLITRELLSINGFDCVEPKGGFYAFPSFEYEITSEQLALRLLDAGLVCVPGTAFGQCGEGHLRFTFANTKENIMKGVSILEEVATTLQ